MSTDTTDKNSGKDSGKNKIVDFNQSKEAHVFERKERKLKTLKNAFAAYLAPEPGAKKKNVKKTKKSKKK